MERMLYAICSCQNLLIVSFIVSWFFLYREYVSILFFTYRVPVISEEENIMRSSLIVSHLDVGAGIKKSVLLSGCRVACIITRTTVSYVIVERNTDYLITDGYVKITYVSCDVS